MHRTGLVTHHAQNSTDPTDHISSAPASWVRWVTVTFGVMSAGFAILLLVNAVFGVVYDTEHFGDTVFILGAAWRVHEGLVPAVDFGHFYGGVMAQGLSASMHLFGHGVFVFDYFTLWLTAALSLAAFVLLRPRISWHGYMATVLLISTLLLTRFPLEFSQSVTQAVSAHSFIYNRFALAVLVVLGLFVALPEKRGTKDGLLAGLAGVLTVLVCLTKPTFVVLAAGLPLALALQGRWRACIGWGAGLIASTLLLDPVLARFTGSFDYAMAHVGGHSSIAGLIRKAVQIPLAQPVALSFCIAGLVYLLHKGAARKTLLAVVVMTVTGIGLATTMGGNGNLGQLALPSLIMAVLAASEMARQNGGPLSLIATCLVLAFASPHMLNSIGITAEAIGARGQSLISQGPYARYVSRPERHDSDQATQYQMMAEGMTALTRLGDPTDWGIIADNGISFEYALLSRPVSGYPLWARMTAPEFAPDRPLAQDVDIVLLGKADHATPVGDILKQKMQGRFVPCTQTAHWDIFRRQTLAVPACR